MEISIITLFPEYFDSLIKTSVVGNAFKTGLIKTNIINLREFGLGSYKKVDDRPFGGGAGMVLMIEPIEKALQALNVTKGQSNSKIILTSAKGNLYTQTQADSYSKLETMTLICGHYGGVDERVSELLIDDEVRIGDYVLSGGEPAACVIIDSIVRLHPGVLGNDASIIGESHDKLKLGSPPQFTRPVEYKGMRVPEVLLGGNHAEISTWKKNQRQKLA